MGINLNKLRNLFPDAFLILLVSLVYIQSRNRIISYHRWNLLSKNVILSFRLCVTPLGVKTNKIPPDLPHISEAHQIFSNNNCNFSYMFYGHFGEKIYV